MVSVHRVADCFIRQSHEVGDPITNLKLQKLVYYAQAWHAALYEGKALFPEEIQAWVHGPVCPELYHRFKAYRWNPIGEEVPAPKLSKRVCTHLEDVMQVYGGFSALDLERMTHLEEPWRAARGNLSVDAPCDKVIPVKAMASYYRKRLKDAKR